MKKILILTLLTTFLSCKNEKKTNFEVNNVDSTKLCCKKGTICVPNCGIKNDSVEKN
jgi:hypothetical protein